MAEFSEAERRILRLFVVFLSLWHLRSKTVVDSQFCLFHRGDSVSHWKCLGDFRVMEAFWGASTVRDGGCVLSFSTRAILHVLNHSEQMKEKLVSNRYSHLLFTVLQQTKLPG